MDWPGMTKKIDVEVSTLLDKLVTDLSPLLVTNPIIIGIHTGGSWLADILHSSKANRTSINFTHTDAALLYEPVF